MTETVPVATPIGSRVLIEMRKVGVTEGGIHIPSAQATLETEGIVLAVGPDVQQIKVGDSVVVPATGVAFILEIKKKDYVVLKESEVLVILGR